MEQLPLPKNFAVTGEIPLTQRAYDTLCDFVYRHSRIRLGAEKHALLSGRLGRRLRELGLSSYDNYCALLKSAAGAEEVGMLIDLVSTNHTHFFRESAHFQFLRDHVLPARQKQQKAVDRPLTVWSAACSSGEEPYSIGFVLAEFGQMHPSFTWHIDASDISRRMLKAAKHAVYAEQELKMMAPDLVRRYFEKGRAESEGYYRVRRQIQERITFHHLNLFQAQYPLVGQYDVIFCRNVMIYFDPTSQEQLVEKLAQRLVPGGYLLIGHAESLLGIRHSLRYIQPSIYQRP